MSCILVKNLNYTYPLSHFKLRNINISVEKGELVVILGDSGSGKTTLLYCMSGVIPHCIKDGTFSGKVLLDGIETKNVSIENLIGKIGIVLQNPESQIFGMSVEEDIAFGLENIKVGSKEGKKRIAKWTKLLGLYAHRLELPENLSGGQKQKLAIASVLAMDPEIIFLDEPFSNLDTDSVSIMAKILKKLKEKGKTIVLVEKKIERLLKIIDRAYILKEGRIARIFDKKNFHLLKKFGFL